MFIKTVFAFGGILLLEMQRVIERSVFFVGSLRRYFFGFTESGMRVKTRHETPLNALAHLIIIRQQHVCTNNIASCS